MNEERHLTLEEMMTYLDAELTPSDAPRCRDHLLACTQCARVFESLKRTVNKIVALPESEAPAGFADEAVQRALDEPAHAPDIEVIPGRAQAQRPPIPRWLPLALAAGLLVVLAALWLEPNRHQEMRLAGGGAGESQLSIDDATTGLKVSLSEIPHATQAELTPALGGQNHEESEIVWSHEVASATPESATEWARQLVYSGFSRIGDYITAQMLDLNSMQTFRTVAGAHIGPATVTAIDEISVTLLMIDGEFQLPLLTGDMATRIFSHRVVLFSTMSGSENEFIRSLLGAKDEDPIGVFMLRRESTVKKVSDTPENGHLGRVTPAAELNGRLVTASEILVQEEFLKGHGEPIPLPPGIFPVFTINDLTPGSWDVFEPLSSIRSGLMRDGVYPHVVMIVALEGDQVGPFTVERLSSASATLSFGRYRFDLESSLSFDALGVGDEKTVLFDLSQFQMDETTAAMEEALAEREIRDNVARAKAEMRTLAVALESYYIDHESYPLPVDEYGVTITTSEGEELVAVTGYIPTCLTTPIAYLSTLPEDPFGGVTGQGTKRARYRYSTSPANSWLIVSVGPDGRAQVDMLDYVERQDGGPANQGDIPLLIPSLGITPYSPRVSGWIYDPTNGIRSDGDIFRTGP